MSLNDKEVARSHFAQMELAYSALLASPDLVDYRSACNALKLPLSKLFYNAYMDLHPKEEFADVDQVEFLGGFFIHDSQGCHNPESASRIVAAIGVSQEAPTLKELLARLRRNYRTGESSEGTLGLIRMALWVAEDTFPPKTRQALYQAVSNSLGAQNRRLVEVFEEIASGASFYSPLSYRSALYLRGLSHLFLSHPALVCAAGQFTLPKRGHVLAKGFWADLRRLVDIADQRLTDTERASLVEQLCCFRSTAARELMVELRSPTEELLALVETYVCPLIDNGQGRPRNNQAQRSLRLKAKTTHPYDIGHFLPHSSGGPKDINLFIQERKLNRGWSMQGKRYRWLEDCVFSRPGTFFFVRPVYGDLSPIPRYLEWGALLQENTVAEVADDIRRMPELRLVGHGNPGHDQSKLSWLISVFENFEADAIADLMALAEG